MYQIILPIYKYSKYQFHRSKSNAISSSNTEFVPLFLLFRLALNELVMVGVDVQDYHFIFLSDVCK